MNRPSRPILTFGNRAIYVRPLALRPRLATGVLLSGESVFYSDCELRVDLVFPAPL